MGDIQDIPTASSKSDMQIRNDFHESHDSPATEVGGVTVSMQVFSLDSSSEQNATTAKGAPVWAGPKQEQSVTNSNPFAAQRMSPTARAFKPSFHNGVGAFGLAYVPPPQEVDPSDYGVVPDVTFNQQSAAYPLIVRSTPTTVWNGNGKQPANPNGTNADVVFSTDKGFQSRHFVKIDDVSPEDLKRIQLELDGKVLVMKVLRSEIYERKLSVYACFDDLRVAAKYAEQKAAEQKAAEQKAAGHTAGAPVSPPNIQNIPDGLFKDRAGLENEKRHHVGTSRYDGQVVFVAKISRNQDTGLHAEARLEHDEVVDLVIKLASSFGQVMALQSFPAPRGQGFRVEFFKISAAKEAVDHLRRPQNAPHHYRGWDVDATSFADHVGDAATRTFIESPTGRTAWSLDDDGNVRIEKPPRTIPKADPNAASSPTSTDLAQWSDSPVRAREHGWSSLPMPSTATAYDESVAQRSSSYPMVDNAMTRFFNSVAADSRDTQEVHIDRIASGHDVRTTIMVRNLPPGFGADDLKIALEATSPGKFDFSYVRIDFEKSQNVGYGFINFIEAEAIIPFCKAFQNQIWPQPMAGPRHHRRGQISYATIQGTDCLIEKFRNSAVMDECPGYRPKIWWAETDVAEHDIDPKQIGTEKRFPGPNNASKHKRSSENAGHIGLFQPNSRGGDRYRGGDRARRSQYDRGTTRQMVEDASYYSYAAGPVFGGMAPIGTPAAYPQQGGYPALPYYAGYPQTDGSGYNMAGYHQAAYQGQYVAQYPNQYQASFPGSFAGSPHGYPAGNTGYGAPFAGPNHGGQAYTVNNRASQLRTLTNGRLATRPRANVTLTDPSRYDPAPGVPRSIVANNGEFPSASGQYYAANNGFGAGQASVNGHQYQYSQY